MKLVLTKKIPKKIPPAAFTGYGGYIHCKYNLITSHKSSQTMGNVTKTLKYQPA